MSRPIFSPSYTYQDFLKLVIKICDNSEEISFDDLVLAQETARFCFRQADEGFKKEKIRALRQKMRKGEGDSSLIEKRLLKYAKALSQGYSDEQIDSYYNSKSFLLTYYSQVIRLCDEKKQLALFEIEQIKSFTQELMLKNKKESEARKKRAHTSILLNRFTYFSDKQKEWILSSLNDLPKSAREISQEGFEKGIFNQKPNRVLSMKITFFLMKCSGVEVTERQLKSAKEIVKCFSRSLTNQNIIEENKQKIKYPQSLSNGQKEWILSSLNDLPKTAREISQEGFEKGIFSQKPNDTLSSQISAFLSKSQGVQVEMRATKATKYHKRRHFSRCPLNQDTEMKTTDQKE